MLIGGGDVYIIMVKNGDFWRELTPIIHGFDVSFCENVKL